MNAALVPSTQEYLDRLWKGAPGDVVKMQSSMRHGDETKYVTVRFDPKQFKDGIDILHITDVQFGHKACSVERFIEYRDWVLAAANRFVLFGGDMVDAATMMSVGSPWENIDEPQSEVLRFAEIAIPMRHRVIGYVGGNHERRSTKTFGDLGHLIATLLKIPYSSGKQFVDIHYGLHRPFKNALWHGRGASRTSGAKMMMLESFARQSTAHCYWVGHLHDCFCKYWTRTAQQSGKIKLEKYAGVMSSSFLSYWGCVDQETECLTDEGWKSWETMRGDENVPTLNLKTGMVEWQKCIAKHVYDYFGEMARVVNSGLNMLLTPNHRVVYRNEYLNKLQVRRMEDMPLKSAHTIPQAGNALEGTRAAGLTPAMASVLGWFIAEGYYRKDGAAGISQSYVKHPRYTKSIGLALTKAGFRFSIHKGGEMVNFYLPRIEADKLRAWIPEKLLTWDLVFASLLPARKLFSALMRGDGCFQTPKGRQTRWSWKQKNRLNRDMFQALAFRLGYNTTHLPANETIKIRNTKQKSWRTGRNGRSSPVLWLPHYAGKVWCLQTPNTTFFARRGGRIFVTGNTYAEVAGLDPSDLNMWRLSLTPDGKWGLSIR